MAYTYDYPRPALTVDCVVFGLEASELKVLLIERDLEPFKGHWALPGGFVNMDETLEQAALRELQEETGLRDLYLEQLYTFGQVDRDPRGRTVSVAYYALVNPKGLKRRSFILLPHHLRMFSSSATQMRRCKHVEVRKII